MDTIRSHRNIPCKGCPDRYLACSDHCKKPEYIAWKAEQNRIREAKQREAHIWGYTANEIRKNRRRGGWTITAWQHEKLSICV